MIEERQTGDLEETMFGALREFYVANKATRILPVGVPPKVGIEETETTLVNRFPKDLIQPWKQPELIVTRATWKCASYNNIWAYFDNFLYWWTDWWLAGFVGRPPDYYTPHASCLWNKRWCTRVMHFTYNPATESEVATIGPPPGYDHIRSFVGNRFTGESDFDDPNAQKVVDEGGNFPPNYAEIPTTNCPDFPFATVLETLADPSIAQLLNDAFDPSPSAFKLEMKIWYFMFRSMTTNWVHDPGDPPETPPSDFKQHDTPTSPGSEEGSVPWVYGICYRPI